MKTTKGVLKANPGIKLGPFSRLGAGGPGLIILVVFCLSRFIFHLKGGSFIARTLFFAKQYLDPELLKNDLLTSLFYLHSQPPLFNFFLGAVLKLSPNPPLSYELLFQTMGALIPLLFYSVCVSLGIRPLLALIATIVFMLNPTLILYENLLYYTYMEGFFVLVSIYFLVRWSLEEKFYDLGLFWLSLLALGLIRSLFHPLFFLLISVVLTLHVRHVLQRQGLARSFCLSSGIVLLPLVALCLKNLLIFGFFGTSSWAGISLWIKADGFSPEELEALHAEGIISSYALQAEFNPFQPVKNYFTDEELAAIPCHHPADCNVLKSSGKPNFNHSGFVLLSKQLWQDARALIVNNPGRFAFYTAGSYSLTLWYSSDSVHALFKNNMAVVQKLEQIYDFLYFGFMGVSNKYADPRIWTRTVVITLCFLLFYLGPLICLFRKDSPVPPAVTIVCLFCFLIHAYTLAVSSLIEFGENNRFRFPVDAAFLVLIAGNLVIWSRLISRRGKQSITAGSTR